MAGLRIDHVQLGSGLRAEANCGVTVGHTVASGHIHDAVGKNAPGVSVAAAFVEGGSDGLVVTLGKDSLSGIVLNQRVLNHQRSANVTLIVYAATGTRAETEDDG